MAANDYGIGYASDGFAGTTAPREEIERLARLANMGGTGEYRYRKPSEDYVGPCAYLDSLDSVLRADLRQCDTWDQARAVVLIKAAQISQTGYKEAGQRATDEEREWGHLMFAASRASDQLERIPGTCRGCNSNPCRCIA